MLIRKQMSVHRVSLYTSAHNSAIQDIKRRNRCVHSLQMAKIHDPYACSLKLILHYFTHALS